MGAWWQLFWLSSSSKELGGGKARPRWGACKCNPHVGQANHLCIKSSKGIMKRKSRGAKCQKVSPFDGEGAEGQVEKGAEERCRGTGRERCRGTGRIGRIAHTINHLSFELFRPVPLHPPDL